ncbi:MAG: glycerol kinase GlpK [Prolixibacteraceae bacterium]|nr:glycerol kinase GlpK [Prolixibacteraceae bacterium]
MSIIEKYEKYILAIDQSTSATKVMLFDASAKLIHRVSLAHEQYYPDEGFVEHDPEEIFENTVAGMIEVLKATGKKATDIAAVSITNQRETSLIWDRTTGKPIANAAVWQCQRGKDFCKSLNEQGYGPTIRQKTGLLVDPYFSASKLRWLINHVDGAKEAAQRGELLLGTMDSWLLWKLTNGKVHATDFSNACRTMLFNINTLNWDDELIELFDLYPSMFPEVKFSDEIFGYTEPLVVFDQPVAIAGLLGDSHAALFGQNCFEPGMAKATYGTGSSIMMNIGNEPLSAPAGLVTSVGYGRAGKIDYVFEGNIHCTGDTINWLVNDAEMISSSAESEQLALSVKDNNQVYFVPSFVGLGAPYWDNQARACISGMARNTKKAHIVRAALESIAYQIKDLIDLMVENASISFREMRVDGGPTRNNFLMQFQSDMLRKEVVRSNIEEISALGAAFMAGLACGLWKDLDEIKALRKVDKTFAPEMASEEIEKLYSGWKVAVKRARLVE